MQDAINQAKENGVIDIDLELSEGQKAQILAEIGEDISVELMTRGYWYKIETPTAEERARRESPDMVFYYTYAGSVQQIEFPLTTVI